jgi:hypothetical protein
MSVAFMTDARRKRAAQNADLLVFLQLLTGPLTFPTGREGIREIRRTSDGWCIRDEGRRQQKNKRELSRNRLH